MNHRDQKLIFKGHNLKINYDFPDKYNPKVFLNSHAALHPKTLFLIRNSISLKVIYKFIYQNKKNETQIFELSINKIYVFNM